MAAPRYIARVLGKFKQIAASVTSAVDAIVATGADGKIDISMMPTGVGAEVVVCTTSENIAAGSFVNLYLNAGVLTARKADATTTGKPADGFVLATTTSGNNATVYFSSNANTQLTGLTIGSDYWLDTTAGGITLTAPTAAGNNNQRVGKALSATSLIFEDCEQVEMV